MKKMLYLIIMKISFLLLKIEVFAANSGDKEQSKQCLSTFRIEIPDTIHVVHDYAEISICQ